MAYGDSLALNDLVSDLEIIEAQVIMRPDGATLINKGSADQVGKGDLWTIYAPAEPVVDPASGASLGEYAPSLAVCKVTRVEKNFSEVRVACLKDECTLKSGLNALRFQDVEALYLDEDGSAFSGYKILREAVGHLNWQGYERSLPELPEKVSSPFKLVIVAEEDGYTVWGGGELLSVRTAFQNSTTGQTAAVASENESRYHTASSENLATPPGLDSNGLVEEIVLKEARSVTTINQAIYNIGFIQTQGTGTPYLLYLAGRTISAWPLNGKHEYRYSYEGFGEIVNMSATEEGLLAVNIYVPGEGMRSKVLQMTDTGFREVVESLDYVLSFLGGTGDNAGPQLLGQVFNQQDLLRPVVYRLRLQGNSIFRGEVVEVPPSYSLFGAFQADLNGNGIEENGFFNPGGRLVVYESGRKVWESSSAFTSSMNNLLVDDPDYAEAAPTELTVWSQPEIFRARGNLCAAFALNKAGWAGIFGSGPSEGTVGILNSSGGSYRLRLIADRFNGIIQDVQVYQDELLVAVAEGKSFSGQGRTHILALPLGSLAPSP